MLTVNGYPEPTVQTPRMFPVLMALIRVSIEVCSQAAGVCQLQLSPSRCRRCLSSSSYEMGCVSEAVPVQTDMAIAQKSTEVSVQAF